MCLGLGLDAGEFRLGNLCLDSDVGSGGPTEANAHVLDDGVEAVRVEAGQKEDAAGKFRQGKKGARVHGADMIDVPGERHQQLAVTSPELEDADAASTDKGKRVFGGDANVFELCGCEGHDDLQR